VSVGGNPLDQGAGAVGVGGGDDDVVEHDYGDTGGQAEVRWRRGTGIGFTSAFSRNFPRSFFFDELCDVRWRRRRRFSKEDYFLRILWELFSFSEEAR